MPAEANAPDRASLVALAERYALAGPAIEKLEVLWARLAGDETVPSAIRGAAAVLDRHIADALSGLEIESLRAAERIADLGAGAGVPGIVLAAARPAAAFAEVESQRRKADFIAGLAAAAGLANVSVVASRVEEWQAGAGAHDLVLARALAAQPVVLEYAAPLLAVGGHVVEWRGRRDPADELAGDAAAAELGLARREVRAVVPFAGASDRHLHVFEKVAHTPERFPRRPGVAARRPLGA